MPIVALPTQLRELADGRADVALEGSSLSELLRALERAYPRTVGWVLDEHGDLRRHVNVFVNGERVPLETELNGEERVQIIPAITGGQDSAAELLVGTRKGLVILRGPRGGAMEVVDRKFPGDVVEFAMRDPRSGRYLASVTSGFFGPRVFFADDPLGDWNQANGPVFPEDAGATIERTWVIKEGEEPGVLWAGVQPGALFRSEDDGESWSLNRSLWDEPSRPQWQGGGGGLCLHSICTWPADPRRLAVGISAAGVWLSDDGGQNWRRGVGGLVPRYVPEEQRADALDLCVHNMHRAPMQPDTIYLQFHGGVYRSDDAGETWTDIGSGLPSDFGFPLVVDPHNPDRALVLPLVGDFDRTTPEGRLCVYETRDRGATWQALSDGLPQDDAYFTILRQAFCHDGRGPLGLYFGTQQGDVYASGDDGATWGLATSHLPPIASVRSSS